MFELLYQGYDSLDIAFQGALDPATMERLKAARAEAEEQDEKQLITIGPGQVEAHILSHGMKGGYRFVLDTGPEGAQWRFGANLDRTKWNGFVSVTSGMLVTRGLEEVEREIWDTLKRMGFAITGHSVNRIDYALDFATECFELNEKQFIAHPATLIRPHRGSKETDDTIPQSVLRGRRTESVTIGKMPGRQIIVYDKRRDTIVKQKVWWFPVWRIDKDDTSREIWRVEIRAGKKELKDKWNLRTLDAIKASMGDVLLKALSDIRYVNDHQQDSNVSRQTLHPLWQAVTDTVTNTDNLDRTGLEPGAVREVERLKAIATAESLIVGNSCTLAAAINWAPDEIDKNLVKYVSTLLERKTREPNQALKNAISKSRRKYCFIR